MKFTSTPLALVTASALAGAALAAPAMARDLSYGGYISATHPVNTAGLNPYFEKITADTNGSIQWKTFYGGAMGGPKELLGAVGDNVLDAAGVVDVYVKSDLPHSVLLSSLFVAADDVLAFAAAMNEFQLLNCPSCLKDYEKNGVKPLAWYSTSPYVLMCTSKVTSLADLQGKKARATSRMGVLMNTLGATAVSVTSAEMYEAMQRGQADCSVGSAAWLTAYNIKDFVKSIVSDPLGAYIGSMVMNLNQDVWDDLEENEQAAIIDGLPDLIANIQWAYLAEDSEAIAAAEAAGAKVYPADKDLADKIAEIRPGEYAAAAEQGKIDGIENADEIIQGYKTLVDKWRGIVAETGGDKAKYAEALRTEIFSKLPR
ncbi:MAG: C4-dicarboxylate TRAP transporter substrate-binding protein [Pseudomonadota bacterium]|nr:C4-dicarboxylate TRAP transporter substrate-binding protein [Pseudomonadota bacterium]